VIAWATPWKIFGARVAFVLAAPALEVGVTGTNPGAPVGLGSYAESMYNPFIGGSLAWDLGGGFGVSYSLGAYVGVKDTLADQSSFIVNRGSLSYTANGWDLTATAIYGTATDSTVASHPDYFNLDLTGTKTFGKWEVGAVGFYSTDINQLHGVVPKQSQFALGGLVGYDWGAMKTQVYLTRDVWEQNYGGFDTRLWGRVILPLGDPFAPGPTLYHK
jgi:hypothetical protein